MDVVYPTCIEEADRKVEKGSVMMKTIQLKDQFYIYQFSPEEDKVLGQNIFVLFDLIHFFRFFAVFRPLREFFV